MHKARATPDGFRSQESAMNQPVFVKAQSKYHERTGSGGTQSVEDMFLSGSQADGKSSAECYRKTICSKSPSPESPPD